MTLPEPAHQFIYSRLAWSLVAAAAAVAAAARHGVLGRRALAGLGMAAALPQWLPGAWSPAYWLGLAFQLPSAFTVALCALALGRQWLGRPSAPVLAPPIAAVLAAAGAWLYLDAAGWLAGGIYYLGFGPLSAPLAALLLASACALAVASGAAVQAAAALFAALAAFMLVRLPTGNLWDAILDPFLWVWAVLVCARSVRANAQRLIHGRRGAP